MATVRIFLNVLIVDKTNREGGEPQESHSLQDPSRQLQGGGGEGDQQSFEWTTRLQQTGLQGQLPDSSVSNSEILRCLQLHESQGELGLEEGKCNKVSIFQEKIEKAANEKSEAQKKLRGKSHKLSLTPASSHSLIPMR